MSSTVAVPKAGNLKFLKASDIKDAWGLNVLIYGPPGAGKTYLASTAQDSPLGKPLLFIDVEGGVRSISDRDDIDVVRPQSFDEILQIGAGLKSGAYVYKTIVVDSLTEAQVLSINGICAKNNRSGPPQQQDWLQCADQIARLIRGLRDLSKTEGINVILTGLSTDVKNEATGAVMTSPAMTPTAVKVVTSQVDAVGYYFFNPKTGKRVLRFQSDGTFIAKIRQPATGVQVPGAIESPTLTSILDALMGQRKEGEATQN